MSAPGDRIRGTPVTLLDLDTYIVVSMYCVVPLQRYYIRTSCSCLRRGDGHLIGLLFPCCPEGESKIPALGNLCAASTLGVCGATCNPSSASCVSMIVV